MYPVRRYGGPGVGIPGPLVRVMARLGLHPRMAAVLGAMLLAFICLMLVSVPSSPPVETEGEVGAIITAFNQDDDAIQGRYGIGTGALQGRGEGGEDASDTAETTGSDPDETPGNAGSGSGEEAATKLTVLQPLPEGAQEEPGLAAKPDSQESDPGQGGLRRGLIADSNALGAGETAGADLERPGEEGGKQGGGGEVVALSPLGEGGGSADSAGESGPQGASASDQEELDLARLLSDAKREEQRRQQAQEAEAEAGGPNASAGTTGIYTVQTKKDKQGSDGPGATPATTEEVSAEAQPVLPIRQLPISHAMGDEELLWRASFIALRDPLAQQRAGPRKLAFLFSFSTNLFFAPLWAKFFQGHEGNFSVYLHGNEETVDKQHLPHVFKHRFVPVEVNGGKDAHMYAVDAARRLVANALLDMENEWFLIVCDLCVPLHSFNFFYNYFESSSKRNFVPHQIPPYKGGQDRFLASCFEPDIMADQWRKGGPWIALTRRLALALVSDTEYYRKFAECCLPVKRGSTDACLSLEHYLATVLPLLGSKGSRYLQAEEVTNWSMVYEDWWSDPNAGRPFVFNRTMLTPKLIRNMRRCHLGNLCHLLGAHFNPSTLRKLMNMSAVLGY